MARRACWRIPIIIKIGFDCCDNICSGTVTNLSERGMFIDTHAICFPGDAQFELSLKWKDTLMYIPVRLVRQVDLANGHNGIGIELLNPPKTYLDFIDNLLLVLKNLTCFLIEISEKKSRGCFSIS